MTDRESRRPARRPPPTDTSPEGRTRERAELLESIAAKAGALPSFSTLQDELKGLMPKILDDTTLDALIGSRKLTQGLKEAIAEQVSAPTFETLAMPVSAEVRAIEGLGKASSDQRAMLAQLIDVAAAQQATIERIALVIESEAGRQAKWWRDPRFLVGAAIGAAGVVVAIVAVVST
jgi:hypothetical protein